MRNRLFLAGMLVAALPMTATAQQAAKPKQPAEAAAVASSKTPAAHSVEDEKAIRLTVDAFTKAYNAGDAKALAALFVANGEIVSELGESYQGQGAIEGAFAEIFRMYPKGQIQVVIESIRFAGPSIALEDGVSTVVREAGGRPERSRYMVVHLKANGTWRMVSARDLPCDVDLAKEEIKQLEWLTGEWVDESPNAVVFTSYHWDENHRAILGDFKVHVAGRPAMSGTLRIGWDPRAKNLRCWVFDSEGGFAEGVWTRSGTQWIAKMNGVTDDGKTASSTNITSRIGKDRMTWQSRDRVIGEEILPNTAEITVVRKPPQPAESTTGTRRDVTGESK